MNKHYAVRNAIKAAGPGRIVVRFRRPAGRLDDPTRVLKPTVHKGELHVRAFHGIWKVRTFAVRWTGSDGEILRNAAGRGYKASLLWDAVELVRWLPIKSKPAPAYY